MRRKLRGRPLIMVVRPRSRGRQSSAKLRDWPRIAALSALILVAMSPTGAMASAVRRRSATVVQTFAIETTRHYLDTYVGVAAELPVSRCSRAELGRWRCRVSVDGGECVVSLQILDEGPTGPPLYVLGLRARCSE
jgi:hypothetical protein